MADLNPTNGENSTLIDLGVEPTTDGSSVGRTEVSPFDIFKLAKGILITCTALFFLVGLARVFTDKPHETGVKEVWEYSKIILNSVVSLVLGLYFGKSEKK